MTSWMLARLGREAQSEHVAANADRLQLLRGAVTAHHYRGFLARLWGYEVPIEQALAATPGVAAVIDPGRFGSQRLLEADLASLGAAPPELLPRLRGFAFATVPEALGWAYVVERGHLLHGQILRHCEKWIPSTIDQAGAYLRSSERGGGARLFELGLALDGYAGDAELASQIADAAKVAFRRQRQWLAQPGRYWLPTRVA